MRKEHVQMVDAADNASATVRGAADTLLAFAAPNSDVISVDVIALLHDALYGAADAIEGVAESIRREDGDEKR